MGLEKELRHEIATLRDWCADLCEERQDLLGKIQRLEEKNARLLEADLEWRLRMYAVLETGRIDWSARDEFAKDPEVMAQLRRDQALNDAKTI